MIDYATEYNWKRDGYSTLAIGKIVNGHRYLSIFLHIDRTFDAVDFCIRHNMDKYGTVKADSGALYDIWRDEKWESACAIPVKEEE